MKSIHDITNFNYSSNSRRCTWKNLDAIILFVNFESTHLGKMEQILLTYGLPKETVAAIMRLYKNTIVKVCSPDGDTDYFDFVAGVLLGYTPAPYLFIICLDYMLRTSIDIMKDNGFKLAREISRSWQREISRKYKNNYGLGLRRWHSFSGKYTRQSLNSAT